MEAAYKTAPIWSLRITSIAIPHLCFDKFSFCLCKMLHKNNHWGVTWLTAVFRSDQSQYWLRCTCNCTSQHWVKKWYGAIRQEAITWSDVDPDPYCYVASLGHNVLIISRPIKSLCSLTEQRWSTLFSKYMLVIHRHEKIYFVKTSIMHSYIITV